MNQSVVYIGIDVAKAHLDVAWAGVARRFPNDQRGRAALVAWIKQSRIAAPLHVICEASGGYEQALLESLEQNALKATLVQATRVRQYARAAGILAKTDTIDAKLLAAFGAVMQPKPTPALSVEQKRLRQYEAQRRHLGRVLLAEENRLVQVTCAELRTLSRSLISKIKRQIDTLDAGIAKLIAQDQALAIRRKNSLPLPEWAHAPLRSCSRKCPSWANSTAAKRPLWLAWHRLITTAVRSAASAPSSAVGALCVADSTWLRLAPPATTRSCLAFINACAPKANHTNSP